MPERTIMWNEITDQDTLKNFMERMSFFHDSCIKELKYLAGAYIDEKLSMYPVNDCRILKVIVQRQFEEDSMIEMEFQGLKYLKLFPADEEYTCEILDSTMIFKDDCIYWCDCGGMSEKDFDEYKGTLICASKFRWRAINGFMGKADFYQPAE